MESLYLLLPMSVLLVLGLIGLFAWALHDGQFDDLEREGLRVLEDEEAAGEAARRDAPLDCTQETDVSPDHNVVSRPIKRSDR